MYKLVCIFCDKVSKYVKGNIVREKLIQCIDLRADGKIRKTALARNESKMLAIESAAYEKLCDHIRHNMLEKPRLIWLTDQL